jgi:hypothetical protein
MRLGTNLEHIQVIMQKNLSNHDLRLFIASDDIDEPPNFDSRDLRLFVSNTTLYAEIH